MVNNVETLVNVLDIVVYGGLAFAAWGTPDATGSKLFCLSGCVTRSAHVQGVWLNHAIFAPEEVIFLGLECRLDKSVLLKTAML